eukprot:14240149-Alexandrium_andersonii.AAC.1
MAAEIDDAHVVPPELRDDEVARAHAAQLRRGGSSMQATAMHLTKSKFPPTVTRVCCPTPSRGSRSKFRRESRRTAPDPEAKQDARRSWWAVMSHMSRRSSEPASARSSAITLRREV